MSAQNNRFYTQEFFKQCFEALNENGMLAFKIQSSENIWTRQLTERNAGIYNAVKSSFENVLVLPGVGNIFVASKSALIADIKILINRFNERKLETKLVSPQYIKYIFTNDRYAEVQKLLTSGIHNINSDLRPVCFSYTLSIWLSKFFPNLTYSENMLLNIKNVEYSILFYTIIVLLLGLIFWLSRKFAGVKRFILVFTAGFTGMTLEIILILLYQSKNGILYRDIGILLMMFMVGLSLGSFIVNRIFVKVKNQIKHSLFLGVVLLLGFTSLIMFVYIFIKADLIANIVFISFALVFNGIFVAGIFSFTSLYKVESQQALISQLYTADLIGGSLGSLLASLVLVPTYGFFYSLIILVILCLASMGFIL